MTERTPQNAPLAIGQVRLSPFRKRPFVVAYIHGDRALVVLKENPENDHSWDYVDRLEEWEIAR